MTFSTSLPKIMNVFSISLISWIGVFICLSVYVYLFISICSRHCPTRRTWKRWRGWGRSTSRLWGRSRGCRYNNTHTFTHTPIHTHTFIHTPLHNLFQDVCFFYKTFALLKKKSLHSSCRIDNILPIACVYVCTSCWLVSVLPVDFLFVADSSSGAAGGVSESSPSDGGGAQ